MDFFLYMQVKSIFSLLFFAQKKSGVFFAVYITYFIIVTCAIAWARVVTSGGASTFYVLLYDTEAINHVFIIRKFV